MCSPIVFRSEGDLITNDISIGLNISFAKAEEIKKKFANVDYNFYETLNKLNVGDLKLDKNKAALNIRLYSIVNDRVKEILNIVKEKFEAYGFIHSIPCGGSYHRGSGKPERLKQPLQIQYLICLSG